MGFFFKRVSKRAILLLLERPVILNRPSPNNSVQVGETVATPEYKESRDGQDSERISFADKITVPSVSVNDLHKKFGFAAPLEYPQASFEKPLTQRNMEIDDSPIFRYIYRHFRPGRHLEFGTWQGTGVLYCLEECDATVWTLNILGGQTQSDGSWGYSNNLYLYDYLPAWAENIPSWAKEKIFGGNRYLTSYQTDAIESIGRFYLEKELGKRVCQIYCDSRDWDTSNYPAGFFDSVLIDGGHTEDVVISDTRKALKLVRSGGLVMWHDFCPKKEVYSGCESTRGSYDAVIKNYECIVS